MASTADAEHRAVKTICSNTVRAYTVMNPHKRRQSLKLSQELKRKIILATFFAWKWPVVKDKHINMKTRIYVLFVFDLDGECKCIKTI